MMNEQEFLAFLEANRFAYQRMEHPAVFTCDESALHRPEVEAVSTKNLFLCDKKGRRFFLAVTSCERTVNLSNLAAQLGVPHLRFASEENLQRLLGVARGSVTMMGLANDAEQVVELWIDTEIWQGEYFLSHPLVNTATLILTKAELERFFILTKHAVHFLNKEKHRENRICRYRWHQQSPCARSAKPWIGIGRRCQSQTQVDGGVWKTIWHLTSI